MAEIKFYNLPYHICSCRDEKGEPTLIARNYRKYYNMIKGGKTGVQVLKDLELLGPAWTCSDAFNTSGCI